MEVLVVVVYIRLTNKVHNTNTKILKNWSLCSVSLSQTMNTLRKCFSYGKSRLCSMTEIKQIVTATNGFWSANTGGACSLLHSRENNQPAVFYRRRPEWPPVVITYGQWLLWRPFHVCVATLRTNNVLSQHNILDVTEIIPCTPCSAKS